jgi:hypothetical protein
MFTVLYACNVNKEDGALMEEETAYVDQAPTTDLANGMVQANGNVPKINTPTKRKIIWTGNMEMEVENVEQSIDFINAIGKKYDAFTSKMNMYSSSNRISADISLRVESAYFSDFINDLKRGALHLDKIEIKSSDVTEEFIDIQSRLKTKREVRDRYITILKTKTGSVKDVLEAEDKIRVITEEIEAKEGRLRYLQDKVKHSTINVYIYKSIDEELPLIKEDSYAKKVWDALKTGWNVLSEAFLALLHIWPLLLLFGFIIWKRKWLLSRFKNK